MTGKKILILYSEQDAIIENEVWKELDYLQEPLAFELEKMTPSDNKLFSQNKDIIVVLISKNSLNELVIKNFLENYDSNVNTFFLIGLKIDDAKIDLFEKLKGKNIYDFKNERDATTDKIAKDIQNHKTKKKIFVPLKSALLKFPLKTGKEIDEKIAKSNKISLFLIQGTKKCGHELLIRKFANIWQYLDKHDKDILFYKVNALGLVNKTEDFIWYALREKIFPNTNIANTAKSVTKSLIERLKNNPIFLTINDIDILKEDLEKIVSTIWQGIYENIESENQKLFPIFIFLHDRSGENTIYEAINFFQKYHINPKYKNQLWLLGLIQRIKKQHIIDWVTYKIKEDSDLEDIREFSDTFLSLISDENAEANMQDVIFQLIENLELEDSDKHNLEQEMDTWFPQF